MVETDQFHGGLHKLQNSSMLAAFEQTDVSRPRLRRAFRISQILSGISIASGSSKAA